MAKNQNEYPVPSRGSKKTIKTSSLLPRFYRTDSNKKFTNATLDQLVQPGTVKKVNGYIGRQNAKSSTGSNIFVKSVDGDRQNYQLEPSLTVKDSLGNVEYYKDYIDYINQLDVFGGNVSNHERLNRQEFYSWNPHIDWDKFVNFQQYYWLPYGPDVIDIVGQQRTIESTYTVNVEDEGGSKEYVFTPNGLTRNPILKLFRGQTYNFVIKSQGEPFSFKTAKTAGTSDRYDWGDSTISAVEDGTITIKIPNNAPNVLFYVSENDANVGGVIKIYNITENTEIDVERDVIGKKTYTLPNGTQLSNGMKLKFRGIVTPEKYATDLFYVEGVGDKIQLVAERDLEIISNYSDSVVVPFDDTTFDYYPFDIATSYSNKKDYIVINRASKDRNPWARYNRWFHKDVIETSAAYNGKIASLDQLARAIRPIIEFEAGLKLFNSGLEAILDVDVIDTFTADVFSTIEGQLGYNVDGVQLSQGQRVLFLADTDILVKNKIYRVEFIEVVPPGEARRRQIRLVEESSPVLYQTALVKYGNNNQGLMYWYNGTTWVVSQTKTSLNQTPLFDVVDTNRYSFGDKTIYDGSTFIGTKLFSYAIGTGTADSELGFALKHKNINNVGDIVFDFNLLTDTFIYKTLLDVKTITTNVGSLVKSNGLSNVHYVNGWEISNVSHYQPIVRVYRNSGKINNFDLDVFDDKTNLDDLELRIYINGKRLSKDHWTIIDSPRYKRIVLNTDITLDDVLTMRAFSAQPKNSNGYYEIPINLQNNPLNADINQFTLGEVIDHVDSIIDNLTTFKGTFPGPTNLRDIGPINQYGTKFVQHSGALPMAMYHITSKNSNVIKAIQESRDDYGKFKREFMISAESLGIDVDPVRFVDLILEDINKNKPTTFPYYFSDMVPYGAAKITTITVVDYRIKQYPLSSNFTLDTVGPNAVLVYVNDVQLVHGVDYEFHGDGFVTITYSELANDDVIKIVEYETTDGSFVPSTPTKLGLWPRFKPMKYLDTSFVNPTYVIQGHDGSIVVAYNDYRDDLLLELEKRIFNNIKVKYDTALFDILDYVPRYNVDNDYSLSEFTKILSNNFYQWSKLIDKDFTKPLKFDATNPITYNYRGHTAPDGREVPGYWRGIYRWLYDTDRPHLCPWEMLGYYIEPSWWQDVYGLAPYTSNNLVMWQDLSEGVIREPGKAVVRNPKFARPYLLNCIPVTENGEIANPIESNTAQGLITTTIQQDYLFGDVAPVESAWRRSSYYPFGVLASVILSHPAELVSRLYDRARVYRDLSGQIVYKDTGVRTRLADVVTPNIYSDTTRVQTVGLVNYLVDYIQSDNLKSLKQYRYDLDNLSVQLSYRIAGFTEKEKFNLLLDSKNPTAVGGVFVPQENYSIVFNTSSPTRKLTYSGVLVAKTPLGFEVNGYSPSAPYFNYYPWNKVGYTINIGGISEAFSDWTAEKQYIAGKIVRSNNIFYRVVVSHVSRTSFNTDYFQKLPSLPMVGGTEAQIRTGWDKEEIITIPYRTIFRTVQEVVDFLLGYGEYLQDQGFIFDDFNNNLNVITNWVTASKEFLFWTTQNWSTGQEKWVDWSENTKYEVGNLIRYEGQIYRVSRSGDSGITFNLDNYSIIEELSSVGSSVIALSPAASSLIIDLGYNVVEDIRDQFNGYEFFRPDGQKLEPEFLNSYRDGNVVQYTPNNVFGIYGATFYLVQKEHVLLIDNSTLFNDTIYEQTTGYRQEKIKISAYISTDWFGGFDIPGFIYDEGAVKNWEPWTDYNLGDAVKHKEFYYSASKFLPGTEEFDPENWIRLKEKPKSQMLPNWTYKAEQFEDFYSLDSDNFDVGQQKMAQHLIGYQKRQYLENIIKDDISEYKFYQGMIIEKGTQNVLNKLFDVLSADNQESIKFFEEWALRVGQYGSNKSYDEIEFTLDESLFKLNPQPILLVNQPDPTAVDFVIRQTPNDVYIKPLNYNNAPWPLKSDFTSYLRTPGYVRVEDVSASIDTLDQVLNFTNILDFAEGSYIWCAFEKRSWNVYRMTKPSWTVTAISFNSTLKQVTLTTSSVHGLNPTNNLPDRYFALTNTPANIAAYNLNPTVNPLPFIGAAGFFKVLSASAQTIVLDTPDITYPDPDTNLAANIFPLRFTVQRSSSIDNISSNIPSRLQQNELIWVDNNGSNKWTVYQHNTVYAQSTFNNTVKVNGLELGLALAVSRDAKVATVTNGRSEVIVYIKQGIKASWIQKQIITLNGNEATVTLGEFGSAVEISDDKTWIAIATPNASSVAGSGTTNQGMVSLYKADANGQYNAEAHIPSNTPGANDKFGTSIKFAGNNTLFVGARTANGTGYVKQLNYTSGAWTFVDTFDGSEDSTYVPGSNKFFGLVVTTSKDASTLVVSAPFANSGQGKAFVYTLTINAYTWTTTINGTQTNEYLGGALTASDNGTYIATGSSYYDRPNLSSSNEGKVVIWELQDSGSYSSLQEIYSRNVEDQELFGSKISFMNDYKTLVIYSANGDSVDPVTFQPTTDSGRVDVYDRYNINWVYSESIGTTDASSAIWGAGFAVANNHVLVSAPEETSGNYLTGVVYDYQKYANTYSWTPYREELPKIDLAKIKKVFLYNKVSNEIVTYLDIVDPIQGNLIGIADQEIRYKTYYDPAIYTSGVTTLDTVNVDDGMSWNDRQVGMLWWDLRTAKFIDAYNGDVVYRNTNWNTLYPTASIDVYEWVETTLKPSQWDAQADTTAGLVANISGKSLYGDSAYCVKKRYDNVAKTFKNIYYFWVKNKTTTPNVPNRNISANNVSKLITDPKGQGCQYVAFTSNNSISLVNVKPNLAHTDVHLVVEYWTIDQYDINSHSQWKLISNDTNSSLPARIENKLIDSFCGKDQADRLVPDLDLPAKIRYGVEDRPRQSMFMNRYEALKQYLERINKVLKSNTIVEDRDISDLNQYEAPPSTITGLYDTVIDTDAELRFVGTSTFRQAIFVPVVVDGRIIEVKIIDAGLGYVNAPYLDVTGPSGINAKIKTILGTRGQVVDVNIENPGEGYDDRINSIGVTYTQVTIRRLTVLVKNDSGANGNWSIYAYDSSSEDWFRIRSQSYDVRNYWEYIDWYSTGYTQFDPVDYVVDATYLLPTVLATVGQIVKVNNVGTGGWLLLEKYADSSSIDYTQSYKIVGRQNGTIQLSDKLYKFSNTNLGYDGPLYDGDNFDNTASSELRIILTTIKNKLLIDNLKQDYLDAFFAMIRYAFSEQTFIDWAFKTSFVRAQHNVGPLKEKVTYNNDNLADFESYVNEVKPYRTKIREFVSSYTALDNTQSVVTDFDLQPAYIDGKLDEIYTTASSGAIESNVPVVLEYPWKHWYDNAGYTITSIEIVDGGTGYLSAPLIKFENNSGSGASATAFIANGRVNRIDILNRGTGYFKAPTITFDGGLDVDGNSARAVAIIGNGLVRSNLLKIKFDRVSGNYFITNLQETETFTASGSQLSFNLKWSPKLNRGDASITVNGIDALDGTYSLSSKKSVTRGYTSYYGSLSFTSPPVAGSVVKISYIKDFNYLSAADRVNFYYNPDSGELGKDVRQLMTGVDYGGVQITGLGFEVPRGWGSLPWFSDGWDSQDPTFEDYIVLISANNTTHTFTLPYTPEAGEQINVYHKIGSTAPIRLDALEYNGIKIPEKPLVIMQTFVGDGTNKTINIPVSHTITVGDEFIFRKSTSDGSIKPSETDYDTAITGGDLAYQSATGLAADDIIIDGDGLVTANTSHGPEEVVPGQIVDALAIKVKTRPNDGSANIIYHNYVYDGETDTFPLGQVPNGPQAVAVLFSNLERPLVIDVDFTVDYAQQSVTLLTMPPVGAMISVIDFGFSGIGLVEIDYFVANGETNEYITGASWNDEGINAIVYVDGVVPPYEIFKTDSTYDVANLVGIRFAGVIPLNALINYAIFNSAEQSFSVMKTETFFADGGTTYTLNNPVGTTIPLEANVIVYTNENNSVFTGPSGTYFTIEKDLAGKKILEYTIPPTRYLPYSIDAVNVVVIVDGVVLDPGIDYSLDLSGITVKIKAKIFNKYEGKTLTISVNSENTYVCSGNTIIFGSAQPAGRRITVISYYKHEYLDIQRTNITVTADVSVTPESVYYYNYLSIFGKRIKLDRPVIDDSRVWIVKNGRMLQQSVDYKLNPDLESVFLTDLPLVGDKFTVMTFGSNVVRKEFEFMIFKDMLNRTHYKRLSRERRTVLLQELKWNDTEIIIRDDRVLNPPNKFNNLPGIIYVNGERIEYFTKVGNVLSQLRRGTLGTGVKNSYPVGTIVQDIGASETVPYQDRTLSDVITVTDPAVLTYTLKEISPILDETSIGTSWYRDTIPVNYGQSNDIDVFVGGYEILGDWSSNVSYSVNDIVNVGSYTFRCLTAHTSSEAFETDSNKWKFFVGNIHLKKKPYKAHNVNIHYESPEGDITLESDFSVRGTAISPVKGIRLTHNLAEGTRFTVVQKKGTLWEDAGTSLTYSNNTIAKFITADLDLIDVISDINGDPLTDNDGNILEI
jgi:hypothetical protein